MEFEEFALVLLEIAKESELGEVVDPAPSLALTDLGIDSLGLVELALGISERFDVEFDESTLSQLETVGALHRYVSESAGTL